MDASWVLSDEGLEFGENGVKSDFTSYLRLSSSLTRLSEQILHLGKLIIFFLKKSFFLLLL